MSTEGLLVLQAGCLIAFVNVSKEASNFVTSVLVNASYGLTQLLRS